MIATALQILSEMRLNEGDINIIRRCFPFNHLQYNELNVSTATFVNKDSSDSPVFNCTNKTKLIVLYIDCQ